MATTAITTIHRPRQWMIFLLKREINHSPSLRLEMDLVKTMNDVSSDSINAYGYRLSSLVLWQWPSVWPYAIMLTTSSSIFLFVIWVLWRPTLVASRRIRCLVARLERNHHHRTWRHWKQAVARLGKQSMHLPPPPSMFRYHPPT
jgi:hypothetical protein